MEISKATSGISEATFVVFGEGVVMGRRVASWPQARSGAGADANTREATESKMTAGLEMEMVGVMGKLKETAGSEAETMAGTESGADTAAGMDLESRVDRSGAVAGAEASARCAIMTAGGDAGADLRSTVAATVTGDDVAVVTNGQVSPIVEMIPSVCAAASEFTVPANARLGIAGMEMEWVG